MMRTSIFLKDDRALRTGHKSRGRVTACRRNCRKPDIAGRKPQLEQQASTVSLLDKALSRKRKVLEGVITYEPNRDASEEPLEAKLNKRKRKSSDSSKAYKPSRDVSEELQEVILNSRKRKTSANLKAYRPSRDVSEEPQEVTLNKPRRKISDSSKSYKPSREVSQERKEVKENRPKCRRTTITKSEAQLPSSEVNGEPQEANPMRKKRKLSHGSKAYKLGRNPDAVSRNCETE